MRNPKTILALLLAALLLLLPTACGTAPADPPVSPSVPDQVPETVPEPEPESVPEEPQPEAETVLEYHPPVPDVEWERGHDQEDVWEVLYSVPVDTPVYAPVPGVVAELSNTSIWPWGKYLVIQAAEDTQVRVCHLSEVDAALTQGSQVDHTTQLGLAGRTGDVQNYAVGVSVSRKGPEGYQSLFLGQCDLLLAKPLEGISYTPPVEGKQASLQDEAPLDANQLYYRTGSTGLPVYSPVTGEVAHIQSDSLWPFGRFVTIQAGEDLQILVVHLSKITEGLEVGDPVDHQTQIGLTGTSGNTTFPTAGVVVKRKDASGEFCTVNVGLWDTVFQNWTEGEFLQ